MGHTQLQDDHRGQNAHCQIAADTDNDCIAVLNAHIPQVFLGQICHQIGVVRKRHRIIDHRFALVNDDQVFSGFRQTFCQCKAKPSQSDHSI